MSSHFPINFLWQYCKFGSAAFFLFLLPQQIGFTLEGDKKKTSSNWPD
jgi:hypothetical protein